MNRSLNCWVSAFLHSSALSALPSHAIDASRTHRPLWRTGDIIGCGFNRFTRNIFFTRNGQLLGTVGRRPPWNDCTALSALIVLATERLFGPWLGRLLAMRHSGYCASVAALAP